MAKQDIRWMQRFDNFNKSLNRLMKAIDRYLYDRDNEILRAGMIHFFETTYELAWNTMKDYCNKQSEYKYKGARVLSNLPLVKI
jgi:hypothetical protein